MKFFISVLVLFALSACGGGGGNGGGGGATPLTFSLSGFITSGITELPIAGATVTLSGDTSASTTTDGAGQYSFAGLGNGNYVVIASLADAILSPDSRPVSINGAAVSGEDFLAFRAQLAALGIEFLPDSFVSSDQLRVSLAVSDNSVIFTDSSDLPLKKQPLDGSPAVALARRFSHADSVALQNNDVFWIASGNLHKTSADGQTLVLYEGEGVANSWTTTDIVISDEFVYWVDTVPTGDCSPPCTRVIQRVAVGGGTPETMVSVRKDIASLTVDADRIYWLQLDIGPVSPGCNCGTMIKSISKSGGTDTVLVDGMLNGNLPEPPPGHEPASWRPLGGIAAAGGEIIFALVGTGEYQFKAIPKSGGAFRAITNVPTIAVGKLDIQVNDTDIFWIDTASQTLRTVPIAGGNATTLASDLNEPVALAVNAAAALWTESGTYGGCCLQLGTGSIKQVPLAGGAVSTAVSGLDRPGSIDVDGDDLVWTSVWRIGRRLPGGEITTLISGISSNLARMVVAQSNVYILDGSLIKTVLVAGGPVEKLASAKFGAIDTFAPNNGDIVADSTSLYWTVRDSIGNTKVQKVSLDGGVPVTLSDANTIPRPQDCYRRIAVDETNVYWSEGSTVHPVGCAVRKVPINGGAATTIFDAPYVTDFAVVGANVYYAEWDGIDSLQKTPVDGGTAEAVVDAVDAWVLTHHMDRLYWLEASSEIGVLNTTANPGALDWARLPFGLENDPLLAIEALFVDESGIYVSESQTGNIYMIF